MQIYRKRKRILKKSEKRIQSELEEITLFNKSIFLAYRHINEMRAIINSMYRHYSKLYIIKIQYKQLRVTGHSVDKN